MYVYICMYGCMSAIHLVNLKIYSTKLGMKTEYHSEQTLVYV